MTGVDILKHQPFMDAVRWVVVLDGKGGCREISPKAIGEARDKHEILWIHLQDAGDEVEAALTQFINVPPSMSEFLLLHRIRPRVQQREDNVLVVLRGINLNPGADPEDMVSPRTWIGASCVVTNRIDRVMAYQGLRDALDEGNGPTSSGDFLVKLTKLLTTRIREHIQSIDERLDDLEDDILDESTPDPIGPLADLRREMLALRRYLFPQRAALDDLCAINAPWLDESHRADLIDTAKSAIRDLGDLDTFRERALLLDQYVDARADQRMARSTYTLSIVAAIFLPLTFLSGLLGMNVAGIPYADRHSAFLAVCAGMSILAVGTYAVLNRILRK